MDIYSVTNIDELAMSFNAEVRINLQWTDPRHDYKHLKNKANFLGTFHILRHHVFELFEPHPPIHRELKLVLYDLSYQQMSLFIHT